MIPAPTWATVIGSDIRRYAEVWYCGKPPINAAYRVVRSEWLADLTILAVHEIKVVRGPEDLADVP